MSTRTSWPSEDLFPFRRRDTSRGASSDASGRSSESVPPEPPKSVPRRDPGRSWTGRSPGRVSCRIGGFLGRGAWEREFRGEGLSEGPRGLRQASSGSSSGPRRLPRRAPQALACRARSPSRDETFRSFGVLKPNGIPLRFPFSWKSPGSRCRLRRSRFLDRDGADPQVCANAVLSASSE